MPGLFDDLIEKYNPSPAPPAGGLFDDLIEKYSTEDVGRRLKEDQDFEPTPEQAKAGYEARHTLPDLSAALPAARDFFTKTIPDLGRKAVEQIPGTLANSVNQFGALGGPNAALTATAAEALLQGTYQLGSMLAPPLRSATDELAAEMQDPKRAFVRNALQAIPGLSWLTPAVQAAVPRSPEQEAAAVGSWVDRTKAAGEEQRAMAPALEGRESFLPGADPAAAALAGNFVDPTVLIPAAKAAGLLSAPLRAGAKAGIQGALEQVAKNAADKGGIVRAATAAAAPVVEDAAEKAGTAAGTVGKVVDTIQPALDVAGLVKGGLPGAAGAHVVGRAASAGLKWAKKVGEAATGLRNVAAADWNSAFPVYAQLAKDADAPVWLKRAASSAVAPAVEATLKTGGAVGEGALHGAGIGAAAGAANDTMTPEEKGGAIGVGGAFGAFGAALGRATSKGARVEAAQAHDIAVRMQKTLDAGTDPVAVLGASDSAMYYADNVEKLFKGAMPGGKDLEVRLLDPKQFAEANPEEPGAVAYYRQTPDGRHEAAINLAEGGGDARLLHEALGHALIDSVVGSNQDAVARIKAVYSPELLQQASEQYAKALKPDATPEEVATYVQSRREASQAAHSDPDAWIAAELFAEAAVQKFAGMDLLKMATPGFLGRLSRRLRTADALPKVAEAAEKTEVKSRSGQKFDVSKGTFFRDEVASKLSDPNLAEDLTQRVRDLGSYRPGVDATIEPAVKVKPTDWGKAPHAPLHDLPGGSKGTDFVVQKPDGTVIERTPKQVRTIVKNRVKAIDAAVPKEGVPAPATDADPTVKLRRTVSGMVERAGTKLGDWFYKGNVFSETTKAFARTIEAAIETGEALAGWYHQIGESSPDWKQSVAREYGNLSAQYKDFVPIGFSIPKKGNLLVRNYSLTAFERKAAQWSGRKGPASLELWNGDVGQFRDDVKVYLKNHAEGRPGADGIGEAKRNVINAFMVGANRTFETANPLRTSLKGEDKQGLVRSYRLDRLETLEPSQVTGFNQPKYEKQVKNLSPKVAPAAQFSPKADWVSQFERDQQDLNNLMGTRTPDAGYDTAFHVTKVVRRVLDNLNPATYERMASGAEGRGDSARVEQHRTKARNLSGALQYVRGLIADFTASLPDKVSTDLRSGEKIDPYEVLKKHFPAGEKRDVNQILSELDAVVAAAGGSHQNVLNLAELARMNGADIDQKSIDKLFTATYGADEATLNAREKKASQEFFNPEFFDTKKVPGGELKTRIQPNKPGPDIRFSPAAPTDSPEFKKWFGGSKVSNADGTPMVVFHGTKAPVSEFKESRTGAASTIFGNYEVKRFGIFAAEDAALAEEYARQGETPKGAALQPLYLQIEEPLDTLNRPGGYSDSLFNAVEAKANEFGWDGYRTARRLGDLWGRGELWHLFDEDEHNDPRDWIRLFKALGYDGLRIYDAPSDNAKVTNPAAWVAFDPTQVKSATANKGTFDPNNPDIRFSPKAETKDPYVMEETKRGRFIVKDSRTGEVVGPKNGYKESYEARSAMLLKNQASRAMASEEKAALGRKGAATPSKTPPTGWILPSGEYIGAEDATGAFQNTGDWHLGQLQKNAEDFKKRFGLTAKGEDARAEAVQKGFVRVRLDGASGRLGIEALAPLKPATKQKILDIVESNSGRISKVDLNLFNRAGKVVGGGSESLFREDAQGKRAAVEAMFSPKVTAPVPAPEFTTSVPGVARSAPIKPEEKGSPIRYANLNLPKRSTSGTKVVLEDAEARLRFFDRLTKEQEKVANDPARLGDPKGYAEYMRNAGVYGDIMTAPPGLRDLVNDPAGYVKNVEGGYHEDLTKPGTKEAAIAGLDSTVEMRKLIRGPSDEVVAGPPPLVTALHHFWGILSRQLPPVQQEAAWLRLVSRPEVLAQIQKSIDGTYDLTNEQWSALVSAGMRETAQGDNKMGNQGTSNANAFHLMLARWNGAWDKVSDVYAAPNSIEMGRRFWSLDRGPVGIKNKVQRFIGLTYGIPGLIMDRWKFVELYMGQYKTKPRDYFNYSATGTPSDPNGIYGAYGPIENGDPVLSLAFYEGLETALQKAIDSSSELKTMLGAHANVGGLHWMGWNAIKNEAVGHSSLGLTYDLLKESPKPTPEDVLKLIEAGDYYTEGLDGNTLKRFSLNNSKK